MECYLCNLWILKAEAREGTKKISDFCVTNNHDLKPNRMEVELLDCRMLADTGLEPIYILVILANRYPFPLQN